MWIGVDNIRYGPKPGSHEAEAKASGSASLEADAKAEALGTHHKIPPLLFGGITKFSEWGSHNPLSVV